MIDPTASGTVCCGKVAGAPGAGKMAILYRICPLREANSIVHNIRGIHSCLAIGGNIMNDVHARIHANSSNAFEVGRVNFHPNTVRMIAAANPATGMATNVLTWSSMRVGYHTLASKG